jgi:pimeloyl-ACP methyl ester carboxylesterase
MKLHLEQFPNTKNINLPGLLYEPERKNDKVLIYLHGNGSSGGLYSVEMNNILGKLLTDNGISYFPFTNTGGHLIQKFDKIIEGKRERVKIGVAYELIKDCVHDINGAVNFLKERGYKHFYLLGVSTGANKIAVYNYYQPNNLVDKFILESGGDDSGFYYQEVGEKKFSAAFTKCREKITIGKGHDLVLKNLFNSPISYQSLYDQINPDGDYNIFPFYWQLNHINIMKKEPLRELKSIAKKTLIIYGDKNEYCYGKVNECVKLIKTATLSKNNFQFKIINDADHSFFNKRRELVSEILNFLLS